MEIIMNSLKPSILEEEEIPSFNQKRRAHQRQLLRKLIDHLQNGSLYQFQVDFQALNLSSESQLKDFLDPKELQKDVQSINITNKLLSYEQNPNYFDNLLDKLIKIRDKYEKRHQAIIQVDLDKLLNNHLSTIQTRNQQTFERKIHSSHGTRQHHKAKRPSIVDQDQQSYSLLKRKLRPTIYTGLDPEKYSRESLFSTVY